MSLFCDCQLSEIGLPDDRRRNIFYTKIDKEKRHTSSELSYIDVVTSKIISTGCNVWNADYARVKMKGRKRELTLVRQMLCYLLGNNTRLTLNQIAERVRIDYDHCSVLHGKKTISNLLATDKEFKYNYFIYFEPLARELRQISNMK